MTSDSKNTPTNNRAVLTKSVISASQLMCLTKDELGQVLGMSPATIFRMFQANYLLNPKKKEWNIALLFLRLFTNLDSITGGDTKALISWLSSDNNDLRGIPAEIIKDVQGLVHTVNYLENYLTKS